MKRILVTGGAGFVGSHLVDALLIAGHRVRVFDNLTPQVHGDEPPVSLSAEAELVRGDMRNPDELRRALDGIEVVFNLAAAVGVGQSMYKISHYVGVNTLGTANLLQELLAQRSRVEKLIQASSMSAYGEGKYLCAQCGEMAPGLRSNDQLLRKNWEVECSRCSQALTPVATDEAKPLQCSSIYALSKRDQEDMALLFGRTYNLPVVALRFFNIYGSRQALSNPYTGVAAIFASRLLNGKAPLVFEDGRQMRDFVSVSDAVQALMLAMHSPQANGKAINVGSGEPVSIRAVAATLASALRTQIAPELSGKYRSGDIRHCFADISAARTLLGYSPRVSLREGIEDLVTWLRLQQPEDRAAEAAAHLSSYGLTA